MGHETTKSEQSNVTNQSNEPKIFIKSLFDKMKQINPLIEEMELFEFEYALENMISRT